MERDTGGDTSYDHVTESLEIPHVRLTLDAFPEHGAAHIEQQEEAQDMGYLVDQAGKQVSEDPSREEEPSLDEGEDQGDAEYVRPPCLAEGHP